MYVVYTLISFVCRLILSAFAFSFAWCEYVLTPTCNAFASREALFPAFLRFSERACHVNLKVTELTVTARVREASYVFLGNVC